MYHVRDRNVRYYAFTCYITKACRTPLVPGLVSLCTFWSGGVPGTTCLRYVTRKRLNNEHSDRARDTSMPVNVCRIFNRSSLDCST